jgi:hypothetical protein
VTFIARVALPGPEFTTAVAAAIRRLDRLGVAQAPLIVLECAPEGYDPDGEAIPVGSASRAAAARKWRVRDARFEYAVRINARRRGSRLDADPDAAGAARIDAALKLLNSRAGPILAAGWLARDAAARLFDVRGRPAWNTVFRSSCGRRLAVVPHPSSRNRAYNPGGVGTGSWQVVAPILQPG